MVVDSEGVHVSWRGVHKTEMLGATIHHKEQLARNATTNILLFSDSLTCALASLLFIS